MLEVLNARRKKSALAHIPNMTLNFNSRVRKSQHIERVCFPAAAR
jgi:hypothetical protein